MGYQKKISSSVEALEIYFCLKNIMAKRMQPFLKRGKNDQWSIYNGFFIKIGTKKNAIKLFSVLLKAKQIKEETGNQYFHEFDLGNRTLKILWSRTMQRFFCEIWVGEEQIGSFPLHMSNKKMRKQCAYFIKHNPEKKELFEKVISLYSEQNK